MRAGRMVVVGAMLMALAVFPAAARAQDDGPDGEVVDLLQQLIRTNTSNPPGNEQQIAELLRARLTPLGFETEIVPTPTPGKAHFIARLRAANPTAKPLLLAGHEDVVGVERDLWSVDPFAGLVRTRAFAATPTALGSAGDVSPQGVVPVGMSPRKRQHASKNSNRFASSARRSS